MDDHNVMDDHKTSWSGSVDVQTVEPARTRPPPARPTGAAPSNRRPPRPPAAAKDEPDLDSLIRAQQRAAHRDSLATVAVVLGIVAVLAAVLLAVL